MVADRDPIPRLDFCFRDPLTIEPYAIRGAQIGQNDAIFCALNLRVITGNASAGQNDVIRRCTAKCHEVFIEKKFLTESIRLG
jgi:hypothetical protein